MQRKERMQGKERKEQVELQAQGGLQDLVLRWFTETQAPLILHNGNFPDWFRGFASRKDTEDLLRDGAPGCFLIRLSHKAVGYILSYKGHDRCRHFVITQDEDGQFVISGDRRTHGSLPELIQHHRVSPIQPFGEHLTSSWLQVNTGGLYDVVSYEARGKTGLSVQALRILWESDAPPGVRPPGVRPPGVRPPALPPKSKSRKLKGTLSVDAMSLAQGVPPLPARGLRLGFPLGGSLPDATSRTRSDPNGPAGVRGNTSPAPPPDGGPLNAAHTSCPEARRTPLPMLNHRHMEEEEEEEEEEGGYSNQLSRPPSSSSSSASSSPTPPPQRTTCLTYSLHDPGDGPAGPSGSGAERRAGEAARFSAPHRTPAQQGNVTYSEVPRRPDDTYEQIPGEVQGNTYESLEDVKHKKPPPTWGKNYVKWKKFLPDSKKK